MLRNAAPALKLVLGLGLCTLGGAMLYVYFKNRDEEEEQLEAISKSKSSGSKAKPPQKEVTIQMTIANEYVPLVVGRGGSNIAGIEEKSRTTIRFRDKDDISKLCEIRGFPDAVKEAKQMLQKDIERSPIVKEEIFVPQSVCGKIIGRCGEAMQEICRQSLAKVSVDSGGRNGGINKRRIVITGNRSQVNIARKLIEDKIQEDEDLKKSLEEVELTREPRRSPTNSISSSMYSSQTSLNSHMLSPREKLCTSEYEKPMEVYVSAIASPSKFWVQLIGPQSKKLDTMVKEMTDYYNVAENREFHSITEPYLGQIVAAVFKYDGKWYRAEVVGILPNEYNPNEVVLDLYFVDYGDSEYVATHEVFELRTDFLTLRFQAIECFLANVKSTLDIDPESWDPQSIARFEELTQVANWKKLISKVVSYKERPKPSNRSKREGSPVPGVELFDLSEGLEVNIGNMLISNGFALPENGNDVLRLGGGDSPMFQSVSSPMTISFESIPTHNEEVPPVPVPVKYPGFTNGSNSQLHSSQNSAFINPKQKEPKTTAAAGDRLNGNYPAECELNTQSRLDNSNGQWKNLIIANWKKLISKVVSYKERPKPSNRSKREGSPVPGVELFDLSEGLEVNIGNMLISNGFALPENGNDVLRLGGGDSPMFQSVSSPMTISFESIPTHNEEVPPVPVPVKYPGFTNGSNSQLHSSQNSAFINPKQKEPKTTAAAGDRLNGNYPAECELNTQSRLDNSNGQWKNLIS